METTVKTTGKQRGRKRPKKVAKRVCLFARNVCFGRDISTFLKKGLKKGSQEGSVFFLGFPVF